MTKHSPTRSLGRIKARELTAAEVDQVNGGNPDDEFDLGGLTGTCRPFEYLDFYLDID